MRNDKEDTILRSDAIKAISLRARIPHDVVSAQYVNMAISAICSVPSADRPQGEWEITGKNHPYKRCPFCKRVRAFTDTRFCDWCGARMKGADDGSR